MLLAAPRVHRKSSTLQSHSPLPHPFPSSIDRVAVQHQLGLTRTSVVRVVLTAIAFQTLCQGACIPHQLSKHTARLPIYFAVSPVLSAQIPSRQRDMRLARVECSSNSRTKQHCEHRFVIPACSSVLFAGANMEENDVLLLQESAVTTAVETTLHAADIAANQLPSNSPVHNAATSVLDVMEELVAPEQALQKRLIRKQKKARYGLRPFGVLTVQQLKHVPPNQC